mmetsp:Transcript_112228/g.317198  ORF Transcript_112228/g.317198 Transcript_112228/m.317198 type:complete len:254 (-) Transcript_112228:382-1143(-)
MRRLHLCQRWPQRRCRVLEPRLQVRGASSAVLHLHDGTGHLLRSPRPMGRFLQDGSAQPSLAGTRPPQLRQTLSSTPPAVSPLHSEATEELANPSPAGRPLHADLAPPPLAPVKQPQIRPGQRWNHLRRPLPATSAGSSRAETPAASSRAPRPQRGMPCEPPPPRRCRGPPRAPACLRSRWHPRPSSREARPRRRRGTSGTRFGPPPAARRAARAPRPCRPPPCRQRSCRRRASQRLRPPAVTPPSSPHSRPW